MTEPTRQWDELLVERVALATAYPMTPDLATAVLARLPIDVARRERSQRRTFVAVAASLAAAALALTVTLLVLRDVRHAVADFLGLAVPGEQITIVPSPPPGVTPTPLPTPPRLESIAARATVDEIQAKLGFRPKFAPGPEPVLYISAFSGLPAAILDYPAYDIWEFKATEGFFGKQIFAGSNAVEQLTIDGVEAYWITGGDRLVTFFDNTGREIAGTQRTVSGRALVFAREGLTFRIEGDLEREEAIQVARGLR